MANIPTIFVSSSCYDLRQVRATLKEFIESLGYEPLVSEFDSFPIQPEINAIENCLKAVEERADLFVLIVGGRYGSTNDQGKSVTNMEYLRARAKGIPIYAFVQKSILNVLPEWKEDHDGDYSGVVDSPRVFEFVTSLDAEGVWVFPFENIQEINRALRKQLAYLFLNSLHLRSRFNAAGLPETLQRLRDMPLRLVIERPVAWEYRLFAHMLTENIARIKEHRFDLNYGIAMGPGESLKGGSEVFTWIGRKMGEAGRLVNAASQIVNVALQEALGLPGTPGDPEKLVYAAKRLSDVYSSAIEWAIECKRVSVDEDEFQEIVRLTGNLNDNIIKDTEDFSDRILTEFEDAVANRPGPDEPPKVLEFTLQITIAGMDELNKELDRLKRLRGIK